MSARVGLDLAGVRGLDGLVHVLGRSLAIGDVHQIAPPASRAFLRRSCVLGHEDQPPMRVEEEPACKPDSVPAPRRRTGSAGWRPSLWGPRRRGPRAAYPGASGGPPAPCLALLRMGFAEPAGHPAAGELLPHRFTLAPAPNRRRRAGPGRWAVVLCGTFRGSPRLGVTQHPALWSPDFPRSVWHRRAPNRIAAARPTPPAIKYTGALSPARERSVE